jgi:hypothetical protein
VIAGLSATKTYKITAANLQDELDGGAIYVRGGTLAAPVTLVSVFTGQTITMYLTGYTGYVISSSEAPTTSREFQLLEFCEIAGYHALAANDSTARPQLSGKVNLLLATATLSTQNVTTTAQNYTLSFVGTGSITLSGTATGTYNAGSHTITCTAGTLTLTVSGSVLTADLRPANVGVGWPAYQAVVDAETYTDIGLRYLAPNGTGQALQRSTITPTGDTVTVAMGIRKTSDAALQIVAEHTAGLPSNNGSWFVSAPNGASADIAFSSKGTAAVDAVAGSLTAPLTRNVMGTADISADTATIYINGTSTDTDTGDQGTGNYAAAALNLFARNQSGTPTLWFGGWWFCGVVAFGPELTPAELASLEAWMNARTRAY